MQPEATAKPLGFDPIAVARQQWLDKGWEADSALGMATVMSLMRAQQIFLNRLDRLLKPYGVTFARYEVLVLLLFSKGGALPLTRISQNLQVHPTSITNAIDRLEAAELVERTSHPTDRRTTLAQLTPKGRNVAERATLAINNKIYSQVEIPAADQETLIDIFTKFRETVGDF